MKPDVDCPLDTLDGLVPTLPLDAGGGVKVLKLGKVDQRSSFCNAFYVYPKGYCANTSFHSVRKSGAKEVYTATIVDGGHNGPAFLVKLDDLEFRGDSPDSVWSLVARKAEEVQKKVLLETVRTPGHELFGLASPLVMRFIQAMSGVEGCKAYCRRRFGTPLMVLKKKGFVSQA
jgi:hypothetical protein